jgi:N-acetylmuramic acid 6-phosphate etherase
MSEASDKRSEEFLKISGQFKLGALVTESSHPVTANLNEVARKDIAKALDLLFQVDGDVISKYREFAESGRAGQIKETVLKALGNGGKIFFTGCGSTGRLSILLVSIWRDFWQKYRNGIPANPGATSPRPSPPLRGGEGGKARGGAEKNIETPHVVSCEAAEDFENRAFSVMAGGDFALIKSVEGFEDFAAFGKKQIGDLGVSNKDVVFAITEGGETSFVIGTAWKGVEAGAKVYFVYNNPDEILCQHVERSREVIQDSRIEKINLTTGPMAITGSTRMQATTIELCVLVTVLEMVVRETVGNQDTVAVPKDFLAKLTEMHATLRSPEFLSGLARIVAMEEAVYEIEHKNTYYADRFGIDVLTDTTERSPTYCTPPFRKFDDTKATESWAFLFLTCDSTALAWEEILKREPNCVEWNPREVMGLAGGEKFERTLEIVRKISRAELMRFKIGLDGWSYRGIDGGDGSVAILSENEEHVVTTKFLSTTFVPSVRSAYIYFGRRETFDDFQEMATGWNADTIPLLVPVPATDFLLDGVTRAGVKMLLNALSTCTMVRLGRVMGNYMIWVVASNLKLIDRATRYIQKLTGLGYEDSNRLLFEVIEYVEPRMKGDQAYPPVVGLAVLRARHKLTNEEAERRFNDETSQEPQGR